MSKVTGDVIQQLKDNERPFGLMTEEMQAKAEGLWPFIQMYHGGKGDLWEGTSTNLLKYHTYRLRPDYKETQGVVECEVVTYNHSMLGYKIKVSGSMFGISHAIERSDFIGFKYEDERFHCDSKRTASPRLWLNTDSGDTLEYVGSDAYDRYEVLTPTSVLFRGKDNE